jgi:acyl-CoA-binding protein
VFVAGARPAIIWIGALGLAYEALIQPIGSWLIMRQVDLTAVMGEKALQTATPEQIQVVMSYYQLPNMNAELFMPIILGVLGIGGYRTWEKLKGKSRDNLHPLADEYHQLSETMLKKHQHAQQRKLELRTVNPSIEYFKQAKAEGNFVPQYLK